MKSRARRACGNDERYSNKCRVDYRWRRRPRRVQMHLPPARNTPSITLAARGFVTGPGAGQWRASSRHTICIVVASFVANNGIHFVIYPMPNSVRRIDTPAPRPTSIVVLLPYRVVYIRYILTLYCLEGLWGGGYNVQHTFCNNPMLLERVSEVNNILLH